MIVVEQRWQNLNRLERGDTGTSFASPQIAGAATILYGAGITSPMAQKALLINSATLGRATPSDPMGSQVGWQPDWGFGELNLDAAYAQRGNTNGAADEVGAGDVRFYRATAGTADRATLVWNRRSNGCFTAGCGVPHGLTLSNLDLFQYDGAQSLKASSTSSIDNVEQVRSPAAGATVYKVKDESTDGRRSHGRAICARGHQSDHPGRRAEADRRAQPRPDQRTTGRAGDGDRHPHELLAGYDGRERAGRARPARGRRVDLGLRHVAGGDACAKRGVDSPVDRQGQRPTPCTSSPPPPRIRRIRRPSRHRLPAPPSTWTPRRPWSKSRARAPRTRTRRSPSGGARPTPLRSPGTTWTSPSTAGPALPG